MPLLFEGSPQYKQFFQDLTAECLSALSADHAELSLTLCNDREIRPINMTWRGVDAATDVLSFPQIERQPADAFPPNKPGEPPVCIGDIVISLETAERQAQEQGHELHHELAVLFVHGLCHLLGHTHKHEEDARAMSTIENRVLRDSQGLVDRSGVLQ